MTEQIISHVHHHSLCHIDHNSVVSIRCHDSDSIKAGNFSDCMCKWCKVQCITGQSGKYFLEQQKNLGKVNGYIEEMMNGQKVVKVFCHEEESKTEFKKLNEDLFVSADRANTYANFLGPMNAQIGNI